MGKKLKKASGKLINVNLFSNRVTIVHQNKNIQTVLEILSKLPKSMQEIFNMDTL